MRWQDSFSRFGTNAWNSNHASELTIIAIKGPEPYEVLFLSLYHISLKL